METELINTYMKIINRVPSYTQPKRTKKEIKRIMLEYGYDEDYIEGISDDFCHGFAVAKEIILKEIKENS